MALSAPARAFAWGDGLTVAAQDLRLDTIGALSSGLGGASSGLATASGVRPGAGNPLMVAVSAGLSVTVATGFAIIQGSAAANSGAYSVTLDSVPTLTCNAADPVNPRIDSVCMTVTDLGTSGSTAVAQIITGTPAASPSAPSLPSNSLLLCNITVAANATTLTSGNLSDQRVYYAAAGGIKQVSNSSFYPTTGPDGSMLFNVNAGRYKLWNGTAVQAPPVAAFAPTQAGPNTATASSSYVTVASASATVDGFTNVKCSLTWSYISSTSTPAGAACYLTCFRGATNVTNIVKYVSTANGNADGGTILFVDDTPAAGTYTYSWQVVNHSVGSFTVNGAFIYLEAESP